MLHATKGIVLRTIKYGDTSLVATIYTELFGIQSYLINGVRTERKSSSKANIYQPTTLLELIVYHQPNKNLQRIKETKLFHLYQSLNFSMVKNSIAIFITELITKAISEQEANTELYDFFEKTYLYLDTENEKYLANYPLFFTMQMCQHLGFGIHENEKIECPIFDLSKGQFIDKKTISHFNHATEEVSYWLFKINDTNYENIKLVSLNQTQRIELLNTLLNYLRLHIPSIPTLKSIDILHTILS